MRFFFVCVYRYTKNSRSDDSVEHLLELGYVRMTNLLPNQVYTEVLLPTEIQSNMPVDQKVFCAKCFILPLWFHMPVLHLQRF